MTKTTLQKNYTTNQEKYQLVLPMPIDRMIPKDDSVRLLNQILEGLNYSNLYMAYSPKGRKPAVLPKTLFKIIIYGYMNNIYSSRDLEKACKRDINFMWLLQDQKAPDHNTIARFKSERLKGVLEDLFSQLVIKLEELGEIDFQTLFIDGTKIEANVNKYTFVWKKTTIKNEEKLKIKIIDFINKLNEDFDYTYNPSLETSLEEILEVLHQKKEFEKIEFVYGKGKRKTPLQRAIETLEELLNRQRKYQDYIDTFKGRNSFSKTDKDATFMHMKEDHMRNSQLKPGYNIQIGVEGEYIVGIDISDERSDQLTMVPFLEKLDKNYPDRKHQDIVADTGYESEQNYTYLEDTAQNCYIKPSNYERSKNRKYLNNMNLRENMFYDEELDEYICQNNKKLKVVNKRTRKSKSGYIADITVYECENCKDCPYKSECTKAKGNRQLWVSKNFIRQRADSLKNITTPKGIELRMNRSIQVEGAFGVLKEDYGFRRFLMRGKDKVQAEFTLLSMGYNINKLHNKIQNNRCGLLLHKKQVS
jgi:transposase